MELISSVSETVFVSIVTYLCHGWRGRTLNLIRHVMFYLVQYSATAPVTIRSLTMERKLSPKRRIQTPHWHGWKISSHTFVVSASSHMFASLISADSPEEPAISFSSLTVLFPSGFDPRSVRTLVHWSSNSKLPRGLPWACSSWVDSKLWLILIFSVIHIWCSLISLGKHQRKDKHKGKYDWSVPSLPYILPSLFSSSHL
jgi:hypothetical protein